MAIEFDPAKNIVNKAMHGICLSLAEAFDWDSSITQVDDRKNYGEARFITTGMIDGRLHVMIFTVRGDVLRIISLRKANLRERTRYEQNL